VKNLGVYAIIELLGLVAGGWTEWPNPEPRDDQLFSSKNDYNIIIMHA